MKEQIDSIIKKYCLKMQEVDKTKSIPMTVKNWMSLYIVCIERCMDYVIYVQAIIILIILPQKIKKDIVLNI